MPSVVNDRSLSGNDISVYVSAQTTKGVINVSPVFDKFRRLEGKPIKAVAYTNSNEVKSNRQARSQIKESTTNSAELSFELNKTTGSYLDSLIHGTQSDIGLSARVTIASDVDGFTDSANGFNSMVVGDYFKVLGMAATNNNIFYRITVKNSDGDVETSPAPATVEAAGASVTIESQKTSSGSDPTYYTIQNRTLDKSAPGDIDHSTFFDAVINTGSLEIAETGIITGSLAFNIENLVSGNAIISGQSDNPTDTSIAASSTKSGGLTTIFVDGVDSLCSVKSFSIEFNNNYQGDRSAACEAERYAAGDVEATGSLVTRAVISNTMDWRSRYRDSTRFSLAMLVEFVNSTDWIILEVEQAVITEWSMADGSNVIASNDMSYGAEEHDTTNTTVRVFRNFT